MSTKIWFTPVMAAKAADHLKEQTISLDPATRMHFLLVSDDIMDPSTAVPSIPQRFVHHVTYRRSVYGYKSPDGVYKDEALGTLRIVLHRDGDRQYDIYSISSPSIEKARKLYSGVRTGKIPLTETYGTSYQKPVGQNVPESQQGAGEFR